MHLWFIAILLLLIIVLIIRKKIRIENPVLMAIYLPLAANIPLLIALIIYFHGIGHIAAMVIIGAEFLYIWIRFNIFPVHNELKIGMRLKVLAGARPIAAASIYMGIFQAIFLPITLIHFKSLEIDNSFFIVNIIYSICCCIVLFLNGTLRAIICSKKLGVVRRVILILSMWIPLINVIVWIAASKDIKTEFEQVLERKKWEITVAENDLCKTKYPLLLIHGVGFRDMSVHNYWGRIPRFLKQFGADIYYGNQEGLGTIEQNGEYIKTRINEITALTGAEKVNIIAHSKGGLDARYAISSCDIADKVASLTTMSTPHHGCNFADVAIKKLNSKIYTLISKIGDTVFRIYGDISPDFYHTALQLRAEDSEIFNKNNPDHPDVYYQSYMSVMKKATSDSTLAMTFLLIKSINGEENDGLVSVESSKWGNFRGVLRNNKKRGISHADIIDLYREDIEGFNVFEVYVGLVSELKEMGY